MKKRITIFLTLSLTLTGCAQGISTSSGTSDNSNIDFNADIQFIANGVAKFDANSARTSNSLSFDEFLEIYRDNEIALNEVSDATDNFLRNIIRAGERLPSEDTVESPSQSKLLAWANGYKSWVYFQKLNQEISTNCINRPANWVLCTAENFSQIMSNQTSSMIKLNAAIQGIQDWRVLANG
jgi:hypothetical protein